jgi:nitrogen fixation protein
MKDSLDEITFRQVCDLITKTLREKTKWGAGYLDNGCRVFLQRLPHTASRFQSGDEELVINNDGMRMYNSKYCFRIGKSGDKKYPQQDLASFTVTQLQSCCACVVFSYAHVLDDLRGNGIGSLLHRWRLYLAEANTGYSIALCSAVIGKAWYEDDRRKEDTNSQEQILLHNGWERTMMVENPKSTNVVGLFQRRLNPEKYRSDE